jgi:hypothetical protein
MWWDLAACRGRIEIMFPPQPGRGDKPDYGPALTLCARCPVIEECYRAGRREHFGVWGGTTPNDRFPRRRARIGSGF